MDDVIGDREAGLKKQRQPGTVTQTSTVVNCPVLHFGQKRIAGIVQVTWRLGAHKRLLTSFAQIQQAKAAGELTLHRTTLVVNCPLIP